jgi:serine/threonine-protein kinase
MGPIDLGLLALSKKLITPEQLEEAVRLHEKLSGLKLQEDFGDILVKKGWITKQRLAALRTAREKAIAGPVPGYEIQELVGRGGMGMVFKARQMLSDRVVAIKLTMPDFANDDGVVERFVREARILASLHHPNIVACVDAGCHGGLFYYVMEFVEGKPLKRIISEKGRLDWESSIKIIKQVAMALDHASQFGIVHRDIKPDNLLITPDGTVKLTDMGVAKLVSSDVETQQVDLTRSGSVVGTIAYMSPEQAEGDQDVDTRSDIYSLGLTFYAMLSGQPPFQDDNPVTALNLRLRKDVPVNKLKGAAPDSILSIIKKMTLRNRDERYQNPRLLIKDLEAIETGSTSVDIGVPLVSKASSRRMNAVKQQPPKIRWKWILVAGTAAFVVACLATLYVVLPDPPPKNQASEVEKRAQAIWQEASDFEKKAGDRLEDILDHYQAVRDKTLPTSYYLKIDERIEALKAQLAADRDKYNKALIDRLSKLIPEGKYSEARTLVTQEEMRYRSALWKGLVEAQSTLLDAKITEAFNNLKNEAFDLCKRGRITEGRVRLRSAKEWKIPEIDLLVEKNMDEYDQKAWQTEQDIRKENAAYSELLLRVSDLRAQKKSAEAVSLLRAFQKSCIQDSLRDAIDKLTAELEKN